MKVKTIPSSWLDRDGRRLDCNPYMSGALEAKVLLERLSTKKVPLQDVCLDGRKGLVNAGRIKRQWVTDKKYGLRFLSSTDILKSDVSDLQLISKLAARANPKLQIKSEWTLITRAGTIGRMAYARPDMDGLACSEDVLRVIPDAEKIPPGYLYAYLSSKFGVPIVVGGTYGAIIQHIEPEHIAGLPVPRLGQKVEATAHELIDEAAKLRDEAAAAQREAITRVEGLLGWTGIPSTTITQAASSALQRRLDAFHHNPRVARAREALACRAAVRLGDNVESVFEPNRGPRLKVDDLAFGIPFLSSSEVFRLDPVGEYSISKRRTPHLDKLLVSERDLLLPRSGQLGGIIGRAVLPLPTFYGHAASEHLVRVRCKSKEDAFFLWSVFASEPGYLATIGTAFGSSIPSLDCELIADMKVPWFDDAKRLELSKLVAGSVEARTRAVHAERKAVRIVEDAIEKGATN
ncbi:MAG: restriction endonuclease subunit S [Myxococcales bacterium]|nr:restriction endonuclease subunit S [Myxococcales bacterium]